eukprot:Clim_evm6s218 gene=Clim_evmTU6s218
MIENRLPSVFDTGIGSLGDNSKLVDESCTVCNTVVGDADKVELNQRTWHKDCFKCNECTQDLQGGSPFEHDGKLYCESDFMGKYGKRCKACSKFITGDVMNAMNRFFYHPECFKCARCQKTIKTGETFALKGNDLLCRTDYDRLVRLAAQVQTRNAAGTGVGSPRSAKDSPRSAKGGKDKEKKRFRTQITEEQVDILKQAFIVNPTPDQAQRQAIAQQTGLLPRVVQVWFQNRRAKVKKNGGELNSPPAQPSSAAAYNLGSYQRANPLSAMAITGRGPMSASAAMHSMSAEHAMMARRRMFAQHPEGLPMSPLAMDFGGLSMGDPVGVEYAGARSGAPHSSRMTPLQRQLLAGNANRGVEIGGNIEAMAAASGDASGAAAAAALASIDAGFPLQNYRSRSVPELFAEEAGAPSGVPQVGGNDADLFLNDDFMKSLIDENAPLVMDNNQLFASGMEADTGTKIEDALSMEGKQLSNLLDDSQAKQPGMSQINELLFGNKQV